MNNQRVKAITEMDKKVFGAILRGARYRAGLTQRDLAQMIGCSQRKISDMETGKCPIRKEDAKRLAKALNTAGYKVFL